jgi:hypothetical protein
LPVELPLRLDHREDVVIAFILFDYERRQALEQGIIGILVHRCSAAFIVENCNIKWPLPQASLSRIAYAKRQRNSTRKTE